MNAKVWATIGKDLKRKAEELAESQNRSLSNLIETLLIEAVATAEAKEKS